MNQYEQFWEKFRVVIIQQGVPEDKALWYVKWARSFARSMHKPLVQRTPDEVNAFLDKLTGQPEVKVWQKEQAKETLRILCDAFLYNCLQFIILVYNSAKWSTFVSVNT